MASQIDRFEQCYAAVPVDIRKASDQANHELNLAEIGGTQKTSDENGITPRSPIGAPAMSLTAKAARAATSSMIMARTVATGARLRARSRQAAPR
jgi:hypothetical protein